MSKNRSAFTIVELLIVIVVIGILALIIVVSYNGITNQARVSSLKDSLSRVATKVEAYKIQNSDTYPATLSTINVNSGSIDYYYNSNSSTYCAESTSDSYTFSVSSSNITPSSGGCINNGLLGWWNLDGNANDSSGRGADGTVTNASLTLGQNGVSNNAYSFTGSNSYILVPASKVPRPDKFITVSAWLKLSGSVGTNLPRIVSATEVGGYALGLNGVNDGGCPASKILFSVRVLGNYRIACADMTPISIGAWRLITGTYDGATVKLYVDGAEVASTNTVFGSIDYNTAIPLCIGAEATPTSCTQFIPGSIDDVRIYDRPLTADEVSLLYAAGAQ